MKRFLMAAAVIVGLTAVGGCSDRRSSPTVPTLAGSAGAPSSNGSNDSTDNPNAVGGDGSAGRRSKLQAAAQCIRQHGAPNYQDPLLTEDGYVYTDDVALRELDGPEMTAIETACRDVIRAANFSMRDQGPPPPKLVQAGVRSAQCLRANGLPNFKDPTVDSRFVPGKGFGLGSGGEMPPGGKQNPAVMRALTACRAILDEEAALSSLGNLGNA